MLTKVYYNNLVMYLTPKYLVFFAVINVDEINSLLQTKSEKHNLDATWATSPPNYCLCPALAKTFAFKVKNLKCSKQK